MSKNNESKDALMECESEAVALAGAFAIRIWCSSRINVILSVCVPFFLLLGAGEMSAGVLTPASGTLNTAIPDNDANGITSIISVSGETDPISDLKLTLNLTASDGSAFNGDYYAYLAHDSLDGFAVLLNRPGKTSANAIGTDGAGFTSVVFDDAAANGDSHAYESTLGAGFTAGEALTGTWAPDGRQVDPANVVDTDSRTALLSSFDGEIPNGDWTLFVADMASGGTLTLSDWSLAIEVTPVPEPRHVLGVGILCAAMAGYRRLQRLSRDVF